MRARTKWIILGVLVVVAALVALPISHITIKLDLPPNSSTGASQPQPLPSGWTFWVVAWVTCAAIGFITICVFVFRLMRRLFSRHPLP
jgi:hypothetical protein